MLKLEQKLSVGAVTLHRHRMTKASFHVRPSSCKRLAKNFHRNSIYKTAESIIFHFVERPSIELSKLAPRQLLSTLGLIYVYQFSFAEIDAFTILGPSEKYNDNKYCGKERCRVK